ncbi:SusC/RagA family TonB-linked outer membrane protein [Sunxiuqinia sp. sy24]|uniref:SusC/RagA family TonB-linked outer membrane protein n=1 Tax=Sunxiuqinia sp. sy24 TaxID=3461495 RepID=UPI00404557BF
MKNYELMSKMVRKVLLAFLVLLAGTSFLRAQSVTLSGNVTEAETGTSLPGVSVFIKGTTTGTITDFDGNYSLEVSPEEDKVIVFSFVGMKTQEIPIGTNKVINVSLENDAIGLGEVVAIGYGVQKKENLTGSVAVIKSEALAERPAKDAVDMLQGVAPGLNITRSSGNIGETASINIRGVTTLGEGSNGSPLVLIDGVEGDLSLINPQDIENISVLKDAASSSIYGSRAPFGVILITTKKGEKGKVEVNYNNSFRSGSPNHWPSVSDSETFAYVLNDNSVNSGNAPYFSSEWLDRIIRYKNGEDVPMLANSQGRWVNGYNAGHANSNWLKGVFDDQSFSQEHNLSIKGGSEQMQYYISGGFIEEEGLLKINTDNYQRYNITGKINASLTSYLDVEFINRFSRKDYQRPTFLNDGIWDNILRQGWPTMPIYDDNGKLFDNAASPILKLRDGGEHNEIVDVNTHQLKFTLKPLEGWQIVGSGSYKSSNQFRQWYQKPFYNYDKNGNPYYGSGGTESNVNEYAFKSDYYNLDVYSDYELEIKAHKFKLMAGGQFENFSQRDLMAQRTGSISPDVQSISTTTGINSRGEEIPPSLDGNYYDWAVGGFFGRLNYNYDNRYLFEANLRYDGSSRFRQGSRWLLVPSFSLGWNVANEKFWNVDIVDQLKVRASYGSLGNQNTDVWYPTYLTQPVGVQDGGWLVSGSQPNTTYAPGLISSSLTWEKVESYNYGLDFALLNSRLSGSFDYFVRNTLDMVGPAPELPNTLGTAVPKQNNTDLKTYGWELSVVWNDGLDIRGDRFKYGASLVLSDSQTEITRYPNESKSLSTYREGQKLGEIWGYETVGIAKTQEEMDAHLAPLNDGGQFGLTNLTAGDVMYKDLNGDNKISSGANTLNDPGDRRVIGNNTPRFRLGTTLSASYKGFDVRAFFQGVLKRDYATSSQMFFPGGWQWGVIVLDDQLDYFRADENHPLGQNLDPYYGRPLMDNRNREIQTKYILDASYVRLKNLTVGYTLPKGLTNALGISNLRVYASGENLFTFTGLTKIYDPELIRTDKRNSYPIFRTYSLGLSLSL